MIRHVVVLKWNEGVDAAHIAAAKAALGRLPGLIPQMAAFQAGSDLGIVPNNFDFAITAVFASKEDFLAYRDHPAHQEVTQTYIAAHAQRFAVQFSEN